MHALDLSSLHDLVRTVAARPALWQRHVRFDAGSRYWHRIASLDVADLWLLTWLPEQGTDLHDHGESAAAFTVVSGVLTEVRVGPGGVLRDARLAAGSSALVPPGAVHDVANHGTGPAVSLHAYAPHLTAMTFWEQAPGGLRRLHTVASDQPEVA